MRIFVAVFPPPEVREKVLASARRLPSGDRVRWIRPENVHLTLKFLGDVEDEIMDYLCAALGEVCERHTPFDTRLEELGAFPSARRARILWVGIGAGSDRLRSLAADLDAALAPLGFEPEKRPYTPHLTLGRTRGRPASFDPSYDVGSFGFRVRHVELTESTLTDKGAVYRTLKSFTLERRS